MIPEDDPERLQVKLNQTLDRRRLWDVRGRRPLLHLLTRLLSGVSGLPTRRDATPPRFTVSRPLEYHPWSDEAPSTHSGPLSVDVYGVTPMS